MITVDKLKVGTKVKYDEGEGGEKCIAKVLKIDRDKKVVLFVDTDDFEWESPFAEIPETVKRIIDGF
jgi:hypothetical protein